MRLTPEQLADGIVSGDRRALAQAITLVESRHPDHSAQTSALFARLGPPRHEALRIGLSGTPGVGKSTFIEAMGQRLTAMQRRVAVLAVDPSSVRTGGSILGDKTRMPRLARDPNAFIRPSPAGRHLGGVAAASRAAVALCEAAGFDVVIIETVGVGQSEVEVREMTDLFLLLLAPGGGDELQGVKRGILECADMVLINKADGDLLNAARKTEADYASALRLMRARTCDPEGWPKVMSISAETGAGLDAVWSEMAILADWRQAQGIWAERRAEQARYWFREGLRSAALERLFQKRGFGEREAALEAALEAGNITPEAAVAEALDALFDGDFAKEAAW